MQKIIFTNIPFPPTVNSIYSGKSRRYKNSLGKNFDFDLQAWYLKNSRIVHDAQKIIRDALNDTRIFLKLKIDCIVPYEFLYTKSDKVKEIDVTNRLKCLLDGIASLLSVDDRYFFLGSTEFLLGDSKYVNIEITHTHIRTVKDGSAKEKGK